MKPNTSTSGRVALLILSASAASAVAQSGGSDPYHVGPVVVGSGGGTLGAGAFQLSGTLGQSQISSSAAAGYRLYGGFWAPSSDVIFASGFER